MRGARHRLRCGWTQLRKKTIQGDLGETAARIFQITRDRLSRYNLNSNTIYILPRYISGRLAIRIGAIRTGDSNLVGHQLLGAVRKFKEAPLGAKQRSTPRKRWDPVHEEAKPRRGDASQRNSRASIVEHQLFGALGGFHYGFD